MLVIAGYYTMPDKYIATNLSASSNETMATKNRTVSHDSITLNFDKRANPNIVAYLTAIQIERAYRDTIRSPLNPVQA